MAYLRGLNDFEEWIKQHDTPQPTGLKNRRQVHSSQNFALEPATVSINSYSGPLWGLCHAAHIMLTVLTEWPAGTGKCVKRVGEQKNWNQTFVRSRYHTRVITPGWLETKSTEGYHISPAGTRSQTVGWTKTYTQYTALKESVVKLSLSKLFNLSPWGEQRKTQCCAWQDYGAQCSCGWVKGSL